MIRRTKADGGFSLVETLVTGVIATVLMGSIFVFLTGYDSEAIQGMTNDLIQQQSEGAIDQISRDVEAAVQVVGPTETYSATPSATAATVTEIRMYNTNHLVFAAYQIQNNGVLSEAHPNPAVATFSPAAYLNFTVGGGNPVYVSAASNFTLAALRGSVTIGLAVTAATNKGVQYTTPARNETVNCRNVGG